MSSAYASRRYVAGVVASLAIAAATLISLTSCTSAHQTDSVSRPPQVKASKACLAFLNTRNTLQAAPRGFAMGRIELARVQITRSADGWTVIGPMVANEHSTGPHFITPYHFQCETDALGHVRSASLTQN